MFGSVPRAGGRKVCAHSGSSGHGPRGRAVRVTRVVHFPENFAVAVNVRANQLSCGVRLAGLSPVRPNRSPTVRVGRPVSIQ